MVRVFDERLNSILKASVTPVLTKQGYKKTNLYYRKKTDGLSHIVNVQRSRWGNLREANFTLNCGIFVPGVISTYTPRKEPINPTIADCCVSARIGMLMPDRLDTWWSMEIDDSASVDEESSIEVAGKLNEFVIPFVARFSVVTDVADFLSSELPCDLKSTSPQSKPQRLAYAAIIYSHIDKRDYALELIDMACLEATNSLLEGFISNLRQKI